MHVLFYECRDGGEINGAVFEFQAVVGKAAFLEGVNETGGALDSGTEQARVCTDHDKPAVAFADAFFDGMVGGLIIVCFNPAGAAFIKLAVKKYERFVFGGYFIADFFKLGSGLDDEAVYAQHQHFLDIAFLLGGVVAAVADQHLVAFCTGGFLDTFYNLIGKGIGDVADDDTDQMCLFGIQYAGGNIRTVVILPDQTADFEAGVL